MQSIRPTILREYGSKVKAFRPNARLFLVYIVLMGAAMGIFRLLFNFYLLSLGYDEAILGRLVTINNLTALLVALPMGYMADLIGRKRALLLSAALSSLSVFLMVVWPELHVFYATNVLFGVGQSLLAITMSPFLMENSGENERTYLFSFSHGLQMAAAFAGSWIGGFLPTWVAITRGYAPTDSSAYAGALLLVAFIQLAGLIPLAFLNRNKAAGPERTMFAPIEYASRHPSRLGKLILPLLLTSIGAGLIMPFMNVFFRQVHFQSDPVIGTLFAWGSLAMGIGLLLAPPLAERTGKIQLVVITQAFSIPFLIMLGFAPMFWMSALAYYIRLTLMNMSTPVYQTFVMENVEASSRATVASLTTMAWNFGWAFSPMISGWVQVNHGFGPVFVGTIMLYSISILLYWKFFWRNTSRQVRSVVPGD
jgi:MFS family permease